MKKGDSTNHMSRSEGEEEKKEVPGNDAQLKFPWMGRGGLSLREGGKVLFKEKEKTHS